MYVIKKVNEKKNQIEFQASSFQNSYDGKYR